MICVSLLSKADQSTATHSISVLSVSFDSLAPARLALRANLRWSISKAPAFSILVNPSVLLPLAIQVGTEFALQLSQ